MNSCTAHYLEINGVTLCWHEWGAPETGQSSILLVHATGFHSRCWDQTVQQLQADGKQRHIIALDQRGHGRSSNTGPINWRVLGRDLTLFIKALAMRDLVAAGHSMGGHCLIQAMAAAPGHIKRALLIDPVVMAPDHYQSMATTHTQFLDDAGIHPVARRANNFDNADAMFNKLKGRGGYAAWLDAALHDYCDHALVPDDGGDGLVLACPPEVEAAIYMTSSSVDVYELLADIEIPVTILRARQKDAATSQLDFSRSPTWEHLASRFPLGSDVYLPQLTHFIPMQSPELVADYILDRRPWVPCQI